VSRRGAAQRRLGNSEILDEDLTRQSCSWIREVANVGRGRGSGIYRWCARLFCWPNGRSFCAGRLSCLSRVCMLAGTGASTISLHAARKMGPRASCMRFAGASSLSSPKRCVSRIHTAIGYPCSPYPTLVPTQRFRPLRRHNMATRQASDGKDITRTLSLPNDYLGSWL
jgi:hypothetical protein